MKQLLQDLSKDGPDVVTAPTPAVTSGTLLIDTTVSLISTGTERMLLDFGKANLVQKARQQPDKVKAVLSKVKTDGLLTTIEAVRSKLAEPIPLGYCNVGTVREAGTAVSGFNAGDRVVSNGSHADVVRVPQNLCARIPEGVIDEMAAFTVMASIGLQGIRLAKLTLGECVAVTGAGLIGLLTVQLLRAQGCRVLALDFDEDKLALARSFGAETCNPANEDPVAAGMAFSRGVGMDAVLITASTKSNDPVHQAAQMSRQRGRIILVGVVGLELSRADFYDKELSFQVSCSYGPGRYDPAYEEGGQDYPLGFVRWTEQRNFEAVLDMMSAGAIQTDTLISHRFDFEEAPKAYEVLGNDKSARGIVLNYPHDIESRHVAQVDLAGKNGAKPAAGKPVLGMIGAGNYGSRILIPAFAKTGATLHTIATSGGTSGVVHGERGGFAHATTDTESLFADAQINTIAIATRHNSHAALVTKALQNGKNVFVEKPLAITREELAAVEAAHADANRLLMVGFNRRFAPQIQTMKKLVDQVSEPKSFMMVMNAGAIPEDHWTQDNATGGGRIIGEACHFIDLMRFLAGASIVSVQARRMGNAPGVAITEDKAAIVLGFEDGSFGTIHYLANGASSFPKERVEVFAAGRTLQLDNFLKLKGFGWPGFKKNSLMRQNKGQATCPEIFMQAVEAGGPAPIPAEELFEVSRVTLEVAEILRAQK